VIVVVATVMLLQIVQSAGLSIRDHIQAARDPIISTSPLSVAQVGDDVTLRCLVRLDNSTLGGKHKVQWTFTSFSGFEEEILLDNSPTQVGSTLGGVLQSNKHTGATGEWRVDTGSSNWSHGEWLLHLLNVRMDQEGKYGCKVILEDRVFSREVILTVKGKQKVETNRQKFVMERTGRNITLDCLDMKGKRQANISGVTVWRKNGETIVVNGTQLKLIRVDKQDSGEYHCLVSGTVSTNITLQVKHPPVITVQTSTIKQYPGYSVSLVCTVSSLPVPLIRWYRLGFDKTPVDSHSISEDSQAPRLVHQAEGVSIHLEGFKDGMVTSRLQLDNISSLDYGSYSCNATNNLGKSSGVVKLEYSSSPRLTGTDDSDSSAPSGAISTSSTVLISLLLAKLLC